MHLAGVTDHPTGLWVAQQARNLVASFGDRAIAWRFLIRDRDAKFTRVFDDVWRSTGTEIIRTPVQAPNANAYAERWVATVRRECLDQLLIVGCQQLVRVLGIYVEHYNQRRVGCQKSGCHAAYSYSWISPPSTPTRPAFAASGFTGGLNWYRNIDRTGS